jgi:hypothetical protein
VKAQLDALARRIDRLARQPQQVRDRWASVLAPVLRLTGWRPALATERLTELVARIQLGDTPDVIPARSIDWLLEHAIDELAENVTRTEWGLVANGRVPDGYSGWLWRMARTLHRARAWARQPGHRAVLGEIIADEADRACALLPKGTGAPLARGIDPLIDAALAETRLLGRQRRWLEAARQVLLQANAAGAVDAAAARARQTLIARRIARLDRLEAAGVLADVDLAYQAREARGRGELQRLHAVLSALEESGVLSGDDELARLSGGAIDRLWTDKDGSRTFADARAGSLRRSHRDVFGDALMTAVERAYARAPQNLDEIVARRRKEKGAEFELEAEFFREWQAYLSPLGVGATLSAAVAVGGCFDLGFAAAPARATGLAGPRLVRHPTEQLTLEPAESLDDLPNAMIGDPRLIVPDLAAGKLLARRYLEAGRDGRRGGLGPGGEARVYLLDGSSSMLGPRARMRDALLIAELATLVNRWRDADRLYNPVLYFRYFNEVLGDNHRVATAEEALGAIDTVLARVRFGGTDIQTALVASFEQVREARREDPELAQAQIVLVTDGESDIDPAKLLAAREQAGDLPIGVSIIALGTENAALRRLAADQRAKGERVFYQFMADEELKDLAEGRTGGLAIHAPEGASADRLGGEVASLVEELDRHTRDLDAAGIQRAQEVPGALASVGLDATTELEPGELARRAALENDRQSLERAFTRAFPAPPPASPEVVLATRDEIAIVLPTLTTIAEVVGMFGAGPLDRQADAIAILHRLLTEGGLPPWRYDEIVAAPPPDVAAALVAVREASLFQPRA